MYMYVYIYMHLYMHICVYIFMYMYVYVCIARCIIVTEMKKKRISEELPHFRKFRQCGLGGGGTEAGVLGSRHMRVYWSLGQERNC